MDRPSSRDEPGSMHPDPRGATGAVEPDPHQAANLIIKHMEGKRRAFLLSARGAAVKIKEKSGGAPTPT